MESFSQTKKTVTIIGAGVSGLTCAKFLNQSNMFSQVIILEAADRVGGRVFATDSFSQNSLDLGGEFHHGNATEFMEVVKKHSTLASTNDKTHVFRHEGKFYTEEEIYAKTELAQLFNLSDKDIIAASLDKISAQGVDTKNLTIRKYLELINTPEEQKKLAYSIYSNDTGTDEDTLTVKGLSIFETEWSSGDENFVLTDNSQYNVVLKEYADEIKLVKLKTAVCGINYKGDKALIKTKDGEFESDFVVCTVPITQLKMKKIEFIPVLPEEIEEAIGFLKMDSVGKLLIKLKNALPVENMLYAVLPGETGNLWGNYKKVTDNWYVCFISGKHCREFEELFQTDKGKFIERALKNIGDNFDCSLESELIDWMWFNWDQVPFIEGAYSLPIDEDEHKVRSKFCKLFEGKLTFAGEAFSEQQHSTLNGAYLTGREAAKLIINSL